MKQVIKFGTDGWRGIIAQDFTFDNVRACAQGVADYLTDSGLAARGLLVAYDTRFDSENFAAASAEVVAASGIKVYLCSRATPTPVTSYGVLSRKAAGAIIITASHNPGQYNGFKYKSELGTSAPVEVIAEVEKRIYRALDQGRINRLPLAEGLKAGGIEYVDLAPEYVRQVERLVDLEKLKGAGLKVGIDSMYGAGMGYFQMLLKGGSTRLFLLHQERNPLFPGMLRPEPIDVNLVELSRAVKRRRASVGLATDGDADRVGVVDEKGVALTPHQIFSLLALYLLEVRQQRGAIVKTVSSSIMLDRLGQLFNVPVYETPVGFKYVAPRMIAENALMGGEESGGFGFRGHVADRDGVLAGAFFLDLMVSLGKTPSQLVDYLYSKVGVHHYERLDVEVPQGQHQVILGRLAQAHAQEIAGIKVSGTDTKDGFRFFLADGYWLLIRFSGTEPIIRIYAESSSVAEVEKLLAAGKKLTGI